MLPTVEEALKELETAGQMNPGPWVKHSMNTGLAARNIAENVPGMDAQKAYIVGLLHDIGRRFGVTDIPTHVYDGYRYCMEKGWDEAARICMTHSYLLMSDEFNYEPKTEAEQAIKAYIAGCTADDYDRLIQLCDSLAVDYGFVILEKRFVDVTRRYGIMEGYIKGWEVAFAIKENFESRMGCSIYDVLPDIGRTTLLTPKPWKPTGIEGALKHWDLNAPRIGEQFNKDSGRLIYKITTASGDYLLKGLPDSTPEDTVAGNVKAHLFLGNGHGMAPKLYPAKTGEYYVKDSGHWFYLMEFIDGRRMEETPEDEYKLGQATRKMHALQGYSEPSPMTQSKDRYYTWFRDKEFVKEFDAILDALPDFSKLDQCFVHTDIGPHNAMLRTNGDVVFIDLDDSGIGSRYLDLGWPFIMQFVDFNDETEEMTYRFDLAKSFLRGYYGGDGISREEYDLVFQGAVQMHISYMQAYGPYAVDSLWKILRFGMDQRQMLWNMIHEDETL